MDNNLEFIVNKETQTVLVTRTFAAAINPVWDAFTKAEILDQWWAPKPWRSKTKVMDFAVGGKRFYAMVGPNGEEHWSLQQFTSINPKTNFKMDSAFADKDENPQLPGSQWDLNFGEENGTDGQQLTKVSISIYNELLTRLEQMIEMGFKEGFTMTLTSLDELLLKSNQ